MAKFNFRCMAINETEYWNLEGTPVEGKDAFGIFFFREKEATYCCSMTPDAWCERLETAFMNPDGTYPDLTDEESEKVFDFSREAERDDYGSYYGYHFVNGRDKRFVSGRLTINVNIRDYKTRENTWEQAREEAREAAWAEAGEYYRCNSRDMIPVVDSEYVWRDWQREQAPKVIPKLPLFRHADSK